MKDRTRLIAEGRHARSAGGAINPPVVHASTVLFPTLKTLRQAVKDRHDTFFYGRFGTPTSKAFGQAIATLEGAEGCALFPSGTAAMACAILSLAHEGCHVLLPDNGYEATVNFAHTLDDLGIASSHYDPLCGAAIGNEIRDNTALAVLESPGSLTFEVGDIPAMVAACRAGGVRTVMDNTWATPLFFKPLAHGVDISVEAATKYIVGHSDAMMGCASASGSVWKKLRRTALRLGYCAAPDDCYLALRGLRTLDVRLQRHQQNGLALARWLGDQPAVGRVLHPALPGCPGYTIFVRDFAGAPGLFSFVTREFNELALAAMVDGLTHFGMGFSWGGFESLLLPASPSRKLQPFTGPGHLIRVHAGLEDIDDLTTDLEAGLQRFEDHL